MLDMFVTPVHSVNFNVCQPARCDDGICAASRACPHRAFLQEAPHDFPLLDGARCAGCGSFTGACPLKTIRMV